MEASFMGKTIVLMDLKSQGLLAFVDVLINNQDAQSVLASSLLNLGPAEEHLNSTLRHALRMSFDRAYPLWEPEWIEEHSLILETGAAHG